MFFYFFFSSSCLELLWKCIFSTQCISRNFAMHFIDFVNFVRCCCCAPVLSSSFWIQKPSFQRVFLFQCYLAATSSSLCQFCTVYTQRFTKSEILGLRFCVKSCGINRASQPTHERHSYILLISIKAVFSFFCAPWGWLHIYKLKSKIYVKNSAKKPGKIAENHENHRFKIIMIRQVFIYFNLVVFTIFGYFSWFLCRIFHINFTF